MPVASKPSNLPRMQAAEYVVKELAGVAKSKKLKGFERIASVHLTPDAFSTDNGLMTPSMKIKRCSPPPLVHVLELDTCQRCRVMVTCACMSDSSFRAEGAALRVAKRRLCSRGNC